MQETLTVLYLLILLCELFKAIWGGRDCLTSKTKTRKHSKYVLQYKTS
jgi:hypothetical protein